MLKKYAPTIVAVIAVLALIGLLFAFVNRRSQMMAGGGGHGMGGGMGGQSKPAGGLVAVDSQGNPLTAAAGETLPEGTAAQNADGLTVAFSLSPYPPAGFDQSTFSVTLTDESGQPVTDAEITLDLTMPAMPMPLNKFDLPTSGGGVYQSNGRFTMRGLWQIEVIIQRGGEKQSVFFQVWL